MAVSMSMAEALTQGGIERFVIKSDEGFDEENMVLRRKKAKEYSRLLPQIAFDKGLQSFVDTFMFCASGQAQALFNMMNTQSNILGDLAGQITFVWGLRKTCSWPGFGLNLRQGNGVAILVSLYQSYNKTNNKFPRELHDLLDRVDATLNVRIAFWRNRPWSSKSTTNTWTKMVASCFHHVSKLTFRGVTTFNTRKETPLPTRHDASREPLQSLIVTQWLSLKCLALCFLDIRCFLDYKQISSRTLCIPADVPFVPGHERPHQFPAHPAQHHRRGKEPDPARSWLPFMTCPPHTARTHDFASTERNTNVHPGSVENFD